MFNINKFIVKKWVLLRMSAQEFYFKEPFEINGEYSIMKSILFFALWPIEMLFIFSYARIYGSLHASILQILLILAIVNLLISNIVINRVKYKPFVDETISSYERLPHEERRKLYSFKNGFRIVSLMVLLPWSLLFIGIAIVCQLLPL